MNRLIIKDKNCSRIEIPCIIVYVCPRFFLSRTHSSIFSSRRGLNSPSRARPGLGEFLANDQAG